MPEYKLYQNFYTSATGNETQTTSNAIRKKCLTFSPEGIQAKQDPNERLLRSCSWRTQFFTHFDELVRVYAW